MTLSRRGALAGALASLPAAIVALPVAARRTDPVFAAITAHQRAWHAYNTVPGDGSEHDVLLCMAEHAAYEAFLNSEPQTLSGLAGFLGHVVEYETQLTYDPDNDPSLRVLRIAARSVSALASGRRA